MKSVLLIIFATLIAITVASNVVVLTPENFDSIVDGSKNILVEFYAPWCGHCKHLEPEYEIAADHFAGNDKVVIAKVNADEHKALGGRFGVTGFPTLKWFAKGWTAGSEIAYDGERKAPGIIDWVTEHAGAKKKSSQSSVVVLGPENFDSIVLDSNKDVLVEFYAPWCGHCKKLAPEYEKFAAAFKNEHNVVVANLDADKHKELGTKYGVTGFPTLKFFSKHNKDGETYSQGRDLNSLVSFINEKAGTHRTATGALTAHAGRVDELDEIVAKFDGHNADELHNEVEIHLKGLDTNSDDYKNGQFYAKVLLKLEKDGSFVKNEKDRLTRLIDSPSTASAKADEFTERRNILAAFP